MVDPMEYQRQQQPLIDEKLEEMLSSQYELFPPLHEAMRYAVFSGGKRIRPILVLAAAEAIGGTAAAGLPSAAAVELVHAYTLVHDDLPALDNDDLRRGQPTVHKKFGEANAILVGDALQALAFLSVAGDPKAAELTRELGEAGVRVVAGQWQDMAITRETADEKNIEFIHEYKTANLLRTAVRLGAIAGGASGEHLTALTAYGTAIGHLFQLTDDLLDADTEEKLTAVAVYGKEGVRQRAEQYLQDAQAALTTLPNPDVLAAIAHFIFERKA